jgi:hypothetical protein
MFLQAYYFMTYLGICYQIILRILKVKIYAHICNKRLECFFYITNMLLISSLCYVTNVADTVSLNKSLQLRRRC